MCHQKMKLSYYALLPLLLFFVGVAVGKKMDCGTVAVCGVLTLETGLGPGVYGHHGPSVHGLWPQVGSYGTSTCVAPSVSQEDPTQIYSCYHDRSFQIHEWEKHGSCAGVKDADDYFSQLCSLSSVPITIMSKSGNMLDTQVAGLQSAGYEIFYIDTVDSQVQLSACLNSKTGKWLLGKVAEFASICGAGGSLGSPSNES
mmetsp:Transcript_45459/g.50604  ORF Transcript_45459/g.50604 Transcript_45459/m.50604 type:complete len:200 (+) Transcript_45459:11-610(+)